MPKFYVRTIEKHIDTNEPNKPAWRFINHKSKQLQPVPISCNFLKCYKHLGYKNPTLAKKLYESLKPEIKSITEIAEI